MSVQKVVYGRVKLWSYFCHLWPKENRIKTIFRPVWTKFECSPILVGCTGVIAVCNAVFQSTIVYLAPITGPEIFAIKSPNRIDEN